MSSKNKFQRKIKKCRSVLRIKWRREGDCAMYTVCSKTRRIFRWFPCRTFPTPVVSRIFKLIFAHFEGRQGNANEWQPRLCSKTWLSSEFSAKETCSLPKVQDEECPERLQGSVQILDSRKLHSEGFRPNPSAVNSLLPKLVFERLSNYRIFSNNCREQRQVRTEQPSIRRMAFRWLQVTQK